MIPMPVMVDPATSTDKFGNPTQNNNPYGFTAPTGPASQALVSYYNKATGQTWTAPSGGYTPPSADWIQGYPGSSQITPMPTFAPGSDLVQPSLPTVGSNAAPYMPIMGADQNVATQTPPPYMPIMGDNRNVTAPVQQPTNQNMGGLNYLLSSLYAPQQAVNSPTNTGGLNALAAPQVPRATGLFGSTQPFVRNTRMPIAGSLASLRRRPTFNRSLPVSFAKPPFRR